MLKSVDERAVVGLSGRRAHSRKHPNQSRSRLQPKLPIAFHFLLSLCSSSLSSIFWCSAHRPPGLALRLRRSLCALARPHALCELVTQRCLSPVYCITIRSSGVLESSPKNLRWRTPVRDASYARDLTSLCTIHAGLKKF